MQNTKLIHLLSHLAPDEYKSFLHFVKSPYHNSNKQVVALLQALYGYHPEFNSSRLTKEKIYKKMHAAAKSYHEGRMNLIMSQLVGLFHQFLAFEQVKRKEFDINKYRLKAYREKRLDAEFEKLVKKQEHLLEKWQKDDTYHLENFLLNKEVFYHPATPRHQVGMPSLENSLRALDFFFVWEKLKFATVTLNRRKIFNEKIKIYFLEEIDKVYNEEIKGTINLNFLHRLVKVQQSDGDESLIHLIEDFIKNGAYFSLQEKTEMVIFLNNLVSQKVRQGKFEFYVPVFKINKFRLQYIIDQRLELLTETAFTNIAVVGSIVHKFDWTEKFIKKYQEYLPGEVRKEAVQLAYAHLYYQQAGKKQEENYFKYAIKYLTSINTNRPFYYYQIKILALKIHFEYYRFNMSNAEFLLDYTIAFEKQLKREKTMGGSKKNAFMNMVKYFRKIIKAIDNPNFNDSDKEELILSINENKNVLSRHWLLEKTRELKTTP